MELEKERRFKANNKNLLLFISILLLILGVVLLLVDPIKNFKRSRVADDGLQSVREQIELGENTEITFVVPRDGMEVNGESYDVYGDEAELIQQMMDDAQADLPEYVTLTAIGIIEIDSVDISIPIWNEASLIALRYGAGHYEGSVLPGEEGNCTILAHHMRQEGAMFNRLDEVEIGDPVRILTVDGHELVYIVDEILTVPPSEVDDYIEGDITDTKQLTLITCTYPAAGVTHRLLVIGHLLEEN
ncbi:MAG: class D sortase [Clostridiales bacterium]|nr:class D sortase [Clostridiales bacterium]